MQQVCIFLLTCGSRMRQWPICAPGRLFFADLLRFGQLPATVERLLLFLIAGEADTSCIIGLVGLTVIAEAVRYFCKYDTIKGVRWSFIPFAFSFFAYTAHWWFDTEGSLAAAVEEMPAGYDQLMIPVINNIPVLILVLVLTIPVAILAMRLAERTLKKPAATLQ